MADVVYVDQFGFTPELAREADALLIRTRTRCDEKLLKDSNVRLIATATIGMDQIDTAWCAANGIRVANAPGCNAPGVAQYVWSALLRSGFDPKRHTLGIVGCGNVGSIVRDWGKILGARILVSDPPREAREREEGVDSGIEYVPLSELLQASDAVTLHTPLTRGGEHPTHHLIGERELRLIGEGRIFVNAARGAVVDFAALKPHVVSGRIIGVIDTWEGEPEVDPELLSAVRYGTFHIAGYSLQGKQRATRMAIEAVEREFGVEIDKDGLEGAYSGTPGLCEEMILASYDPMTDTLPLRQAPEQFDTLRRNYTFRSEPIWQ